MICQSRGADPKSLQRPFRGLWQWVVISKNACTAQTQLTRFLPSSAIPYCTPTHNGSSSSSSQPPPPLSLIMAILLLLPLLLVLLPTPSHNGGSCRSSLPPSHNGGHIRRVGRNSARGWWVAASPCPSVMCSHILPFARVFSRCE